MLNFEINVIINNKSGNELVRNKFTTTEGLIRSHGLLIKEEEYSIFKVKRICDDVSFKLNDVVKYRNKLYSITSFSIGNVDQDLVNMFINILTDDGTVINLSEVSKYYVSNIKDKIVKKNGMELITTYICKGSDIGVHDNMFGGTMMSLIDDASAAYAMQICDNPRVVTLKIDELVFKKPVKIGNLIKIYGQVKEFGNTSLTLYIEVRKHNVYTGIQEIVIQTNIKFVRIDEEGNPVPIGDRIKNRYQERIQKYGRGLLTPDEIEIKK